MAQVLLVFENEEIEIDCSRLEGVERLGESIDFRLEGSAPSAIKASDVVGKGIGIMVVGAYGQRLIRGVVWEFTAKGHTQGRFNRHYRLRVRSMAELYQLRTRTKVFQELKVQDIIKEVLTAGGMAADKFADNTKSSNEKRLYVTQYQETDAAFIRRMCEEEGLYYRFDGTEDAEKFTLEDTSKDAPKPLPGELPVYETPPHSINAPHAIMARSRLVRRPGKVTVKDYTPKNPSLELKEEKTAGTPVEQQIEVYAAPGHFDNPGLGKTRAERLLDSLRVDTERLFFETTAIHLQPGEAVTLETADERLGTVQPNGDFFITALRHSWSHHGSNPYYTLEVESIPSEVPFRLPRKTKRPTLPGVHSATVTGASGEEIHIDKDGCCKILFHWDREGPTDDKSSLPVRVVQPNTTNSMLHPRVGWEVAVAFEDGDPDRPYVLGRLYNNKTPPPYSLPTNKTMTVVGTHSSPGGGGQNVVHFDDAAGRQNINFHAAFAKTTAVTNNMMTQTANNENLAINGSQSRTVGAKEEVSITQAYINDLGSQTATVGASQNIFVKGDTSVSVASETVTVGGAVLEKVGNPVTGAINLGVAAALEGVGTLGKVGAALQKVGSLAKAGYDAYQKGGLSGAAKAVGMGALSMAADTIPGGGALVGAAAEALPSPWEDKKLAAGSQVAGGGSGGATDNAKAGGPGPGHRNTAVKGTMTEVVGAAMTVTTPGNIGWETLGAATYVVGGPHKINAGKIGLKVLGACNQEYGTYTIKVAGNLVRDVKGAIKTNMSGNITQQAGGKLSIESGGAVKAKIGGTLTVKGGTISFICGSSKVTSSPGGVLIESSSITITGATTQSGTSSHS
jgi:type VI secretion system secreted protein VgrG